MNKNQIGVNAGIVWRIMASNYSWTIDELKKHTNLSDAELWSAIGWLARESQVEFDENTVEMRIYLNQISFF